MHTDPEQGERIQTDGNAYVVDDAAPEVTGTQANITLLIYSRGLHNDGSEGQDGLEPSVLEDASLHSKEGMRIGDIDFWQHMVQGPEVVDGCTTVGHDYESSLAIDVVDEKLEEGIYRKGLVYVAYGSEKGRGR